MKMATLDSWPPRMRWTSSDGVVRPRALSNPPRQLVDAGVIAAFVTTIVATNYALISYPNVKLFDLMVFVAGYVLGVRRGIAVAVLAWVVYGNFNPYGLTTMSLLVTVMASEAIYAVAGALVRKVLPPSRVSLFPGRGHLLLLGGVAVVCTLAYDLSTNIYTGISWAQWANSTDYIRWIRTALFNPGAAYFYAAHIGSNLLLFTALAPILIRGAEKFRSSG